MLRVSGYAQRTDTGRQRRANEDALLARAPLFAVADGMGGAQAGEVAAGMAIDAIAAGVGDGAGSPEEQLERRVQEANARIHELSQRDQAHAGMGTTATAAYVGERDVVIAHVGDSRAYLLRGGVLERLTDDHSLVEEFVRQGRLTPEEADEHPQRSIITRALGPEPEVVVDRLTVPARGGDVFLLCSDGLTSMLAEPEIAGLIQDAPSLDAAARTLVEAANAAGGRDNISVVLFSLEQVDRPPDDPSQATMIGRASATTEEVRAALAAASSPVAPTAPRRRLSPRQPSAPAPRRRRRWVMPAVVAAIIAFPILGGAYLAIQAVYFVGTTENGAVAVFKGLPWELPGGIDLYTTEYVTGLTVDQLPAGRRQRYLNHKLRSHDDARDLVRELELGRVSSR